MELRKGYKHSILGPIPVDWIEGTFEDFMTGFSSGQTPYRAIAEYYKGDIPWITSGELNYNIVTNTIEKISKEGAKAANLKMIPKGTFLFAITGLEAAGTRGSCAITGIEATTNQSCMALYPKANVAITPYIFQFYVKYGNWLAFNYCQGTKQQSYTGGIAKKLPFVAPSTMKEQTAIATALSDADAYISALEKLIEKKRNIKQGAMQQLLKPKKGWEEKEIKEIFQFRQGIQCSIDNQKSDDKEGLQRFIRIIDLTQASEPVRYIDDPGTSYHVDIDDLFMVRYGNPGLLGYGFKGVIANNLFRLIPKIKMSNKYFYYLLSYKNEDILQLTSSTTMAALNFTSLNSLKLCFPLSIDEQKNIVSILNDMDNEITSLEKKLSKSKLLKQGMMQELLTGKIRLI